MTPGNDGAPGGNRGQNPSLDTTTRRHQAYTDGLARRRAATRRLAPLDCGCADPWTCRHPSEPLTERTVGAWRDAAVHLDGLGSVPAVPIEVLRAIWRRGGQDRVLAELLHDRGVGA